MVDRTAATLVYDGECPFCSAYVRYLRLREHVDLQLVDARRGGLVVKQVIAAGLNLDQGFVLLMGGACYHADETMHVLALLSSRHGLLNRFNAALFSNRLVARAAYPVLRFCRNCARPSLEERESCKD